MPEERRELYLGTRPEAQSPAPFDGAPASSTVSRERKAKWPRADKIALIGIVLSGISLILTKLTAGCDFPARGTTCRAKLKIFALMLSDRRDLIV
jgi:hypothetical protein